jgi:hypothetical protein
VIDTQMSLTLLSRNLWAFHTLAIRLSLLVILLIPDDGMINDFNHVRAAAVVYYCMFAPPHHAC